MKTHIIICDANKFDRLDVERIEGERLNSIDEIYERLKGRNGARPNVISLDEFTMNWNDTDDCGRYLDIDSTFIAYVFVEEYDVAISTIEEDWEENEGGYYVEIAIIDNTDGEIVADNVGGLTIYKEDLMGLKGDERYTKARDIATEYMLSVKNEMIRKYKRNNY